MKNYLRIAKILAAMLLFAIIPHSVHAATAKSGDDDYIPSDAEIEKMMIDKYRATIRDQVERLHGRRLSEVKKKIGIKDEKSPGKAGGDTPQQVFFLRRNRLDMFQLDDNVVPLSSAKGAAISITRDELAGTTATTVNGRLQAVAYRSEASPDGTGSNIGVNIAPYVDAQGTTNSPKKKSDASTLQTGVDFQFSTFGGPIAHNYFIVTPYYQTDYSGIASADGVKLAWEPRDPRLALGGTIGQGSGFVDWYWQLHVEADLKDVHNVGSTGLVKGQYSWIGGTAQAHFVLFPDYTEAQPDFKSPGPAFWVNRLFANASLTSYVQLENGRQVTTYGAELGYNISTDGKSSVSVKYDQGTDKDTLVAMRKYLMALNIKY
ncbi:MAG: hypothetical protein EKK40_15835 [Bradyrhizobiaceae bacterium]|nr:MAG: hypothetical protein EKK40_15835 [Bradyrhizobiaceae bacterium]